MSPAPKTILLVDDDAHILDVLEFALKGEGHQVRRASSGEAALQDFARNPADLVILDLMLPGMDGTDVLRELRRRSAVPILMLTCRDEEIDRVLNLEMGADDYVTKPFSRRELLARVKVLFRRVDLDRGGAAPEDKRRWGHWEMDDAACRALFKGKPLHLSVTEFQLLAALMRAAGATLSRARLLDALDPDDLDVSDRAIDSHIKRIRAKIKAVDPKADPLEAVYGLGYRLKPPE